MVSIKYQNAYKEVLEIIKYLPKKEFNKIPKEKIEYFEKNKNINYEFNFDVSIPLEEQKISREANAIILNLFNDYFLSSNEQKEKLKNILEINEKKYNEMQREKYNPDNIFDNKDNINNNQDNVEMANNLPIEVDKDNIFTRIIGFVKKIFHINN